MFTLVFVIVLIVSIYFINKKNEQDLTDDSLIFEKQDSITIIACLISSIILNKAIATYLPDMYLILALISALPYSLIMTIVNTKREARIVKKQEQIRDIYEATKDILGNINQEDIDYANLPFTYEISEEAGTINKIVFDTSVITSSDNTNTTVTYSLNKYFDDFQWISDEKINERQLIFNGLPKPPKLATYPGSDYRPNVFVPFGLSGKGEVGWYITKDSRGKGFSQYKYENGKYADNVETVTTPQFLLGGSTGGGKFIWEEQEVEVRSN